MFWFVPLFMVRLKEAICLFFIGRCKSYGKRRWQCLKLLQLSKFYAYTCIKRNMLYKCIFYFYSNWVSFFLSLSSRHENSREGVKTGGDRRRGSKGRQRERGKERRSRKRDIKRERGEEVLEVRFTEIEQNSIFHVLIMSNKVRRIEVVKLIVH